MDVIYVRNPDIIFRKIADEFILVPIRQKAVDLKSVYTLNVTAAFIWELIDGKRSVSLIKDRVAEEFEIGSNQAQDDVSHIVSQWEDMSLIQKA
ncbi:MAG: PqqD family protein [Candidatus Omnitrophota bacterium]